MTLKPETMMIIDNGIGLVKLLSMLAEDQRCHVIALMREHLVVAALVEGMTVDELEERLKEMNHEQS